MEVRADVDDFGEALTDVLLEEAEDTADFLEGEAFAAEFGDYRDLEDFLGQVESAVAFLTGGYDFLLIPPLQLAEAYAGDGGDVG